MKSLIAVFLSFGLSMFAECTCCVANKSAVVDAGNKTCPVTGKQVDGEHSYVHKGKQYNLCCNKCVKKFEEEAEKFAAIVEEELEKLKE